MQIQKLRARDQKKAIAFAIEGMHFNKFTKNKVLLRLYGRYFWYLAYTDATDVLAAYEGETLLGVLTVHMHSEKRPHRTALRLLFIKFAEWVQKLAFGKGAEPYSRANLQMYGEYFFRYRADGEIGFLAADPKLLKRGVGSFLLRALEERYPDKEFYLFTDESCSYLFYDRRGFERFSERDIVLHLKEDIPLKCFLYRKRTPKA